VFPDSTNISIIFRGVSLAFGFWFVFGSFVGYEGVGLPIFLVMCSVIFWATAKHLEKEL
jgi:4-hydroxybenzoate polyprenyltransferase